MCVPFSCEKTKFDLQSKSAKRDVVAMDTQHPLLVTLHYTLYSIHTQALILQIKHTGLRFECTSCLRCVVGNFICALTSAYIH